MLVVAEVGVVALALAAFMAGRLTAHASGLQPPSAVDVGFSRDMGVHHQQAVLMSVLVRDRGEDPELRSIAVDMVLTQQNQAGQMQGWLTVWGVPFASTEPLMRWMGGKHAGRGCGSRIGPVDGALADGRTRHPAEVPRLPDAVDSLVEPP